MDGGTVLHPGSTPGWASILLKKLIDFPRLFPTSHLGRKWHQVFVLFFGSVGNDDSLLSHFENMAAGYLKAK